MFEAAGHIVCDPPGVSIFVRGVTGEEPLFYYDYAETPAEARAYHHYVELVAEAGQHIGPADIWCKPNSLHRFVGWIKRAAPKFDPVTLRPLREKQDEQ